MLQKINGHINRACQLLKDADPHNFFPRTLEFSPPARGTWNIVHTALQLPEAHQIYICASGCLRGVVLTAAERGAMNRFSTIELLEKDLVRTDNERLIIDGITDILTNLPNRALFKDRLDRHVRDAGYDLTISDRRTYDRSKVLRGHYDFATSAGLRIESVRTLDRGCSDHLPILVKAAFEPAQDMVAVA